MATASTADSSSPALTRTLATIAVAYTSLGGVLMTQQGVSAGAVGRIVVVLGLCLLTARGANWARLLLGAFIVPIAVLLLTRLGSAAAFGWFQLAIAVCIVVALGGYLALFRGRGASAAFAERRRIRSSPPPAAT